MGRLSEQHPWMIEFPKPKKLESTGFNLSVGCYADLWNTHVKIEDAIFYFERTGDTGNINVRLIQDNGNRGDIIATAWPKNHNYLELQFKYHGITCHQRIRYNEIRRSMNDYLNRK